jgi:hypothetical protein
MNINTHINFNLRMMQAYANNIIAYMQFPQVYNHLKGLDRDKIQAGRISDAIINMKSIATTIVEEILPHYK